jgi:hypothetical protein
VLIYVQVTRHACPDTSNNTIANHPLLKPVAAVCCQTHPPTFTRLRERPRPSGREATAHLVTNYARRQALCDRAPDNKGRGWRANRGHRPRGAGVGRSRHMRKLSHRPAENRSSKRLRQLCRKRQARWGACLGGAGRQNRLRARQRNGRIHGFWSFDRAGRISEKH